MEIDNYLKQANEIIKELIASENYVDNNIANFLLDPNKNIQNMPEFMENLCGENLLELTLIHKCVILTAKFQNLNNILRNYFKICPEFHDSINATTDECQTALHLASQYSKTFSTEETVKLLIDAGTNVNLQDNTGSSALHLASYYLKFYSTEETIIMLVLNGAKINLKNKKNKTPVDLLPDGFKKIKNMLTMMVEQKKCIKIIGECVICFTELESFICNYDHYVCFECLVRLKNNFCPICFKSFKLLQSIDI